MTRLRRVLPLLIAFAVVLPPGALTQALQPERWARYQNPRFGTIVDYPADLFSQPLPEPPNGDGRSFRTADGRATFGVFGSFNALELTPARYVTELLGDLVPNANYRRVTDTWFVLAGTKGAEVFYQRCNFTRDLSVLHCLTMTYPADEARAWDGVVTRMSRSLRFVRGQDH